MWVAKPIDLSLDATIDVETADSRYPAWVNGTYYFGDIVHSAIADGGDGHDYKLTVQKITSSGRPESVYYWTDLGPGQYEVTTYTSSIGDISDLSDWTSGSAISRGDRRLDVANFREYEAMVDISAGDNVERPSACVSSPFQYLANRWLLLGPARGVAFLDQRVDRKTDIRWYEESLECTVQSTGRADVVGFYGLRNIASIVISVTNGEVAPETDYTALQETMWEGHGDDGSALLSVGTYLQVSTSADAFAGGAIELQNLVIGETYTVVVNIDTNSADMTLNVQEVRTWTSMGGSGTVSSAVAEDKTFTFTATATRGLLRAVFASAGAQSAEIYSLSIKGPTVSDSATLDLEIGSSGLYYHVFTWEHDECVAPVYEVEFVKADMGAEGLVGLMAAGVKTTLGVTEADVDVRLRDWSRKEVDDTYGTAEYQQRGFSKRFTAKLWIEDGAAAASTPDEIWATLTALRGQPCLWDFSDSGDIRRLQVFGHYREAVSTTTGLAHIDAVELDMEGLVE